MVYKVLYVKQLPVMQCSDIVRAAGTRGNALCAATSTAYIPVCSFVEMIPNKRLQQLWINGSI